MTALTLYTNPYSRGRIIRWMLEELEVPYDIQIMEFGGNIKSPEYVAINPMGKVPAIVHDGAIVTEVAAICAYLADRFPEKNLAPAPNSALRGSYYRWLFFAAGPLEMATTATAYGWEINEKNATAIGCGLIESTGDTLENSLETAQRTGPYICGEQFTAADVVLSSYIGWAIMQKNLEPRAAFTDYVERTEARPAAIRANKLDNALIKE